MITPAEARIPTGADDDTIAEIESRLDASVRGLPIGGTATIDVTDLSPTPIALQEVTRRAAAAGWAIKLRSSRMGEEIYVDIREAPGAAGGAS